jgi:hypothetical protein
MNTEIDNLHGVQVFSFLNAGYNTAGLLSAARVMAG